ncbi:unnamed protein product [Triticum turgidum subsp. durum]|uniref:Chlorophyllase n=1 Tax=Triticum turgidum subsp. durum TaxID=4567 RepID=A0A9R0WR81_TRITD|nr:unnamed protein product [Triticum turgidum subsp. durum]
MAAMATTVFQAGPMEVDVKHVDKSMIPNLARPLMVVAPKETGAYPVIVFLHGWNMLNSWYEQLLTHVASHGFIAVAPQLYWMVSEPDADDIDATKRITNWLADHDKGLAHVLKDVLKLEHVEPDLSKLALAGHSRGGQTAFAVALGLGDAKTKLELKFSALIGVDPVAGVSRAQQLEPKVLTFEPDCLDVGMPVLVMGTGLGPKHIGGFPCAPVGVNHAEFYKECAPPRYHLVVKDYGHLDMLDDNVPYIINNCMCMRNQHNTKDLARRTMGGAMVAFLRANLGIDARDLIAIYRNPELTPAILDQVDEFLPCFVGRPDPPSV